jgi:two-component system LytT family response regulator
MVMEAPIRTILVDDEAPARARLRQLLKLEPGFTVIAECANGNQAVEAIQRDRPDLVFLDVQMPRLNGVEVCHALCANKTPLPLIIFVTAYDTYALKAFELHAVDYLLKPFDRDRFSEALRHAERQLSRHKEFQVDARLASVLQELSPGSRKPDRLVFKENGRIIFLQPDDVHWVEADGNYIRVHATDGSHYVRDTLASLESQLPSGRFMRISRSMIVNLDRIKELQPLFYGDYAVILKDGSRLSMSRSYRDRLENLVQRPRAGGK